LAMQLRPRGSLSELARVERFLDTVIVPGRAELACRCRQLIGCPHWPEAMTFLDLGHEPSGRSDQGLADAGHLVPIIPGLITCASHLPEAGHRPVTPALRHEYTAA